MTESRIGVTRPPRPQAAPRPRAVAGVLRREPILALVILVLVALVPPVAIAAVTGSFGIPHNDDWSFIRSATTLHRTGDLRLVGWAQMTMVGQLYLVQPFLALGAGIGGMQAMTVVLTLIGAGAAYLLGRRVGGPRAGLVAAAVLLCCPLTPPLLVTFMTDLPALALSLVALAVGVAGVVAAGRRGALLVAAGLVFAFIGVAIRETAAPAAVGIVAALLVRWWTRRSRADLLIAVVAAAGFGVAVLVFLHWRHDLPGDTRYAQPVGGGWVSPLIRMFVTLAIFVLPVVLLPVRERASTRWRLLGAVAGAAVALYLAIAKGLDDILIGNYLQYPAPLGPVLRGHEPMFVAPVVWKVVGIIGLAGCVLLGVRLADLLTWLRSLLALGRTGHQPGGDRLVAWSAVAVSAATSLGLVVLGASRGKTYDRYVLPVAIMLAIALLANARRPLPAARAQRAATAAGGIGLALGLALGFSLALTLDTYDAARWRAGAAAVSLGADPADVDAGFEWISYHQSGPAYAAWSRADMTQPSWVRRMHAEPCWFVSLGASPRSDVREMRRISWDDAFGRDRTFVIYHDERTKCHR